MTAPMPSDIAYVPFVSVENSVQGMRDIIHRWTPDDSGVFLDHTGRTLPW